MQKGTESDRFYISSGKWKNSLLHYYIKASLHYCIKAIWCNKFFILRIFELIKNAFKYFWSFKNIILFTFQDSQGYYRNRRNSLSSYIIIIKISSTIFIVLRFLKFSHFFREWDKIGQKIRSLHSIPINPLRRKIYELSKSSSYYILNPNKVINSPYPSDG